MILYSEQGLELLGNVTPAQMETIATEAMVHTNAAAVNSEIPLVFTLVYVGPVRFSSPPPPRPQRIYGRPNAPRYGPDNGDILMLYITHVLLLCGRPEFQACAASVDDRWPDNAMALTGFVRSGEAMKCMNHTRQTFLAALGAECCTLSLLGGVLAILFFSDHVVIPSADVCVDEPIHVFDTNRADTFCSSLRMRVRLWMPL